MTRLTRKPYWPKRWSVSRDAIYYQTRDDDLHLWDGKKWFRLGSTEAEAFALWYARTAAPRDSARTIGELIDAYRAEELPNKAPRTQTDYLKALDRLLRVFGHMPPKALLPRHVYQYMAKRPKVAANREKAVLSSLMTFAVKQGAVDRNLVREVRRNPEAPRDRYVSDTEIEVFLGLCSPLLKAYVDLKLLTGARQGQLLRLTLSDWDGEQLVINKAKGGRSIAYRGPGLAEAIEACLLVRRGRRMRSIYLFSTRSATPYTGDGFRALWQYAMTKYLASGGIRFTEHDLRAKVASDSESLSAAQARMGHQASGTTNRVYRRKPATVSVLRKADRT